PRRASLIPLFLSAATRPSGRVSSGFAHPCFAIRRTTIFRSCLVGLAGSELVLRGLPAGEVRRRTLLALGVDHAIRDQLPDRQRLVLRGRSELLVDLLDTQTWMRLDERRKLRRKRLEILCGALATASTPRPADGRRTDERGGGLLPRTATTTGECRFKRVD